MTKIEKRTYWSYANVTRQYILARGGEVLDNLVDGDGNEFLFVDYGDRLSVSAVTGSEKSIEELEPPSRKAFERAMIRFGRDNGITDRKLHLDHVRVMLTAPDRAMVSVHFDCCEARGMSDEQMEAIETLRKAVRAFDEMDEDGTKLYEAAAAFVGLFDGKEE